MERTGEHSWVWRRLVDKSTLKPSMSCECNGKITEHWGVANLFSLMQQLGVWPAATKA
jgi:hypothetical protein